jgi:hypothetical protein
LASWTPQRPGSPRPSGWPGNWAPPGGLHVAAEALVYLRKGDARTAAKVFAQGWLEIERSSDAEFIRPLRVARAFAMETSGGEDAMGAAELLAGARPFRPGEFTWLGAGWPELARHLRENGLEDAG